MTIVLTDRCNDGWVTRDARWTAPDGRVVMGVSRLPCEKCDGKGCPKAEPATQDAHD